MIRAIKSPCAQTPPPSPSPFALVSRFPHLFLDLAFFVDVLAIDLYSL